MISKAEETYTFLSQHTVASLSTVSKEGEPWGANVYYTVSEKFIFYFMTHVESKKCYNLKANPKVALTVVANKEQATVQLTGNATELSDDSQELKEAFRQLAHVRSPGDLRWTPPVSKMRNGKIVVFRVVPTFLKFSKFNTNHLPPRPDIEHII